MPLIAVAQIIKEKHSLAHLMLFSNVRWPVWNPWQGHSRFFFMTFSVTRQEIIQFTCHASAETVTLHTFFHSENRMSM